VFVQCPADIGEGLCGDVVFWDEPVVIDNCPDITIMQTEGPVNGSVFPVGTTQVVYEVSDPFGNIASCSFNVTVNTIVAQGGPALHAYYGYENSVELSVTVSGGTAPYNYQWSPAGDLNDATIATPTYTPSYFGTFVFTVTVTDANGCTGTATQTVVVEDVRCSNNQHQVKIMICHNGETVCVNQNSVEAHLGHGDYLGPCVQGLNSELENTPAIDADAKNLHVATPERSEHSRSEVVVAPNPFKEKVDITVNLPEAAQWVSIRVYDVHGMFVHELYKGGLHAGSHKYQWRGRSTHGNTLTSGVYLIVVQSDMEIITKQVVLMH
jgi:hypothetical protein